MQPPDDPSAARTRRMLDLLRDVGRRPPAEREDALRSACGDDDELYREVGAMLAEDDASAGPFDETRIAAGRSLVNRVLDIAAREEPEDVPLPPCLGAYTPTRLLGEGSMGAVYEAEGPDGRVALKLIHPHLLSESGLVERFLREAEIGRQVRHENVVRSFASGTARVEGRSRNFLVMEYVEGGTLRDLLQELQCVPEELCRHIGREVAKGLSAVHAARVIHRDLKPENVLITPDHVVKVMDLGVALLQDQAIRLSRSGDFVGSIEYAAPEQFGVGGEPDDRVDLYALGVLLYELATGRHPHRDKDFSKLLKNIVERTPRKAGEINPQLSAFFEEVVHTLLQRDREQRFDSASQVADVLDHGERSAWWRERATALRQETRRPLRRIRIARETAVYGRDDDLAKLQRLFDKADAGDGQVLLLEGEAGVGKTRLVDEFVRRLGPNVNFLFGSYPPGGAATASGAFSEAYREQFGAEGLEQSLADVLTATPVLVPAFAAVLRGEALPSEAQALTKDSLQTVFVHATHALAAERTTIVLIDDLHFAPEEGRALFSSLAMAAPGHRVLLVGTMRPGVSERWIAEIDRLDHATHAQVARLGPKDLAKLLEDVFRSERLAGELGHQIALKSDGNPFFAFEIIQGLREGRFIARQPDGSWATTRRIEEISVPSSVAGIVNARVAELADDERTLLDIASCLGFEFESGVVATVLGIARIVALQMLGRIEKRHRLVHAVGDHFVFDHHQVQETLYEGLSKPLREEYHAAIATALEDGGTPLDICEHHLRGVHAERALPHLDAALDELEAAFLNERAIALADRALDLLEGERRLEILLRKSSRLHLLGRRAEQEPVLAEARTLAADKRSLARVEQAEGDLLASTGRYEDALGFLERALACFREVGDGRGEVGATTGLGRALRALGRYDDAQAKFERSLALSRELGDRRGEAGALGSLGTVLHTRGHHEASLPYLEQELAISVEIGDRAGEVAATGDLGNSLYALGRYEEALAQFQRSLAIAREIGNRHGEAITMGGLGSLFQTLGRYGDALAQCERYLAIAREIGQKSSEAVALVNLGPLWLKLGQVARARAALQSCLELCLQIGARYAEGYALRALGDVAAQEGDPEAALAFANRGLAVRRETGHGDGVADSLIQLGELHLRAGAFDAAGRPLQEALQLLRAQNRLADVAHAAALLARLPDGDVDAARTAFEAAGAKADALHVLFPMWQVTGERSYLDAAKRLLDEHVEHVPEEYRASMIANVTLHREIMEAWDD